MVGELCAVDTETELSTCMSMRRCNARPQADILYANEHHRDQLRPRKLPQRQAQRVLRLRIVDVEPVLTLHRDHARELLAIGGSELVEGVSAPTRYTIMSSCKWPFMLTLMLAWASLVMVKRTSSATGFRCASGCPGSLRLDVALKYFTVRVDVNFSVRGAPAWA